jgi:hypothetical protein
MYYDLIASLPYLPHFEQASHLPITPLRLKQRLARLQPEHSDQIQRAESLVRWRPTQVLDVTDESIVDDYERLMKSTLDTKLRDYIVFRLDQQTLLAALRRKYDGLRLPAGDRTWGVGPRVQSIRRHWDAPDFGLLHLYPWLPGADELMAAGDARGLERLLMGLAWHWLSRCAECNMFGFESVFSYVFKWQLLRAWLACDADRARLRFTQLVDQVTNVERR